MRLVNTKDFGIRGHNFYFSRRERWNITLEELRAVGVMDGDMLMWMNY